jgi:hypothetical protein
MKRAKVTEIAYSQLLAFQSILTLPAKVRSMHIYTHQHKNQASLMAILCFANNVIEVREIDGGQWKEGEQSYIARVAGN